MRQIELTEPASPGLLLDAHRRWIGDRVQNDHPLNPEVKQLMVLHGFDCLGDVPASPIRFRQPEAAIAGAAVFKREVDRTDELVDPRFR